MKAYEENNELVICLEGKLSSANADEITAGVEELRSAHPGMRLGFDAGELHYCSSAGLRLLLGYCKMQDGNLTVRNVTPELYEILESTGLTGILDVRKKIREVSVEGCEMIGSGAAGTVYRIDEDTVVKVYRNKEESLPLIEEERRMAKQAFLKGIPTAIPFGIVKVGEQYGSVFELVKAKNGNELILERPEAFEDIIGRYSGFLKSMHSVCMEKGDFPSARDRLWCYLEQAAAVLSAGTSSRLGELIGAMPENNHVIHGDAQLKNIMFMKDSLMLIDMEKLCLGDPVFEFGGLYATYVAFNEDDPLETVKFYGLSKDMAERIVFDTLRLYMETNDSRALDAAADKIRAAGYLRFLHILIEEYKNRDHELKAVRIRHAAEKLDELAWKVSCFELKPVPDFTRGAE